MNGEKEKLLENLETEKVNQSDLNKLIESFIPDNSIILSLEILLFPTTSTLLILNNGRLLEMAEENLYLDVNAGVEIPWVRIPHLPPKKCEYY